MKKSVFHPSFSAMVMRVIEISMTQDISEEAGSVPTRKTNVLTTVMRTKAFVQKSVRTKNHQKWRVLIYMESIIWKSFVFILM